MRAVVTADLTLEPQTAAHAEQMFVVLGDPAIYEYGNQSPSSLEWLRERFPKLESRCSELAGYVQATVQANGHASIACVLSSASWGRGLARRAMSDSAKC